MRHLRHIMKPQSPHTPLLHRSEDFIYHDIIVIYNIQFLTRLYPHILHITRLKIYSTSHDHDIKSYEIHATFLQDTYEYH